MAPITLPNGLPVSVIPGMGGMAGGNDVTGNSVNPADLMRILTNGNPSLPLDQMIQQTTAIPGAEIPMPKRQYPDIKTASGEFMTRSGNRRNAFNNLMSNVGNVIQTARQNSEAQQQRTLAVDLERLLIAAQNPQDPHNQQVMNDILSDKKKRKAIEKALDISFLGNEDKRDPISKGALDMALKRVQGQAGGAAQGQTGANTGASGNPLSALQQFMKQMPTTATLTPQAQATEQLTKAKVLPSADEQIKAKADLLKQLSSNDGKEKVAGILAASHDRATFQRYMSTLQTVAGRVTAAQLAAWARVKASENVANALKERQKMIEARFKGKGNNNLFNNLKKEADSIQKSISTDTAEFNKLRQGKGGDPKVLQALGEKIYTNTKRLKDVQDQMEKLNNAAEGGVDNVNINLDTRTGNAGSGTGDNFDPDSELNTLEQEFNAVQGGDDNQ